MKRPWAALIRVAWYSFWNTFAHARSQRHRWLVQAFGLATLIVVLSLASEFVLQLASRELGATLHGLVFQALAFFTLIGVLMVVREAMDRIGRVAYQAAELPWLFSSPFTVSEIFVYRLGQVLVASLPGAFVWLLPPWFVMGRFLHAHWGFYLAILPLFLLLVTHVICVAAVGILLMMRFLASHRILRGLKILGVLGGFSVGLLLALFFIAEESQKERVFRLLLEGRFQMPQITPDIWVAQILTSFFPGAMIDPWHPFAYLLGSSVGSFLFALWLASRIYHSGWEMSQTLETAPRLRKRAARRQSRAVVRSWLRRWGGRSFTIVLKDLRTMRYNAQYIMMASLLAAISIMTVFLLTLSSAATEGAISERVPALVFQITFYSLIIGWPLTTNAFRGEAPTWWLLQSAPISAATLFKTKLLLSVLITGTYAAGCLSLGMLLLDVPGAYWLPILGGTELVILTVSTLNLAVGALPWFAEIPPDESRNPVARIGTILAVYLIDGVILVGIFLLIMLVWTIQARLPLLKDVSATLARVLTLTFIGILQGALMAVAARFGKRALERLMTA